MFFPFIVLLFSQDVFQKPSSFANEGFFSIASINDSAPLTVRNVYRDVLDNNIVLSRLSDKELLSDSITVYYPEADAQYPLVLFVHGWGAKKSAHRAMARYMASFGFVTATLSSRHRSKPYEWLPAIQRSFALLEQEAQRPDSPLYNKIDFKRKGLVGHSMGGTAVLHYTNRNNDIASVIALHPYNGGKGIVSWVGGENEVLGAMLKNHKADTFILSGNADAIALPEKSFELFKGMSNTKRTLFFCFDGYKHNYPVEVWGTCISGHFNRDAHAVYRRLVAMWMITSLYPNSFFSSTSRHYFDLDSVYFNTDLKPLLKGNQKKAVPAFIQK